MFNRLRIKIGWKPYNPLEIFPSYRHPPPASDPCKKVLLAISPNLHRLLTKDWFISLQSFTFQWEVSTLGETETLSTLAKIFDDASQLPNLRIFEWSVDCFSFPPPSSQNEKKSKENEKDSSKELQISKDLFSNAKNLFPRVETMKLDFYSKYGIFVKIPIQFFEKYFAATNCLTELQLKYCNENKETGIKVI